MLVARIIPRFFAGNAKSVKGKRLLKTGHWERGINAQGLKL
jgi:hypothetical protein